MEVTTVASIIAKTIDGAEFMWSRRDCYAVSKAGADDICAALNGVKWRLKDGEKWKVYEVEEWEIAYTGASIQKLTRRGGKVFVHS